MSRKYKNVYTILEKVKKGEIQSYYKDKDGLFGRINFYKKPDLIKPHMHYLDEGRLDAVMQGYLANPTNYQQFIKRYNDQLSKLNVDGTSFIRHVDRAYKKFPEHMIRDVFKMFYNRIEDVEFTERTDKTQSKYKFLEKANNPVAKIMSEKSSLKSAIFARNIMGFYAMKMALAQLISPEDAKDIQKSMDGKDSEFDSDEVCDQIDKMFDDKKSKDAMEEAVNQATKLCKELDKTLDDELQEAMFEGTDDSLSPADITANYVDNISQRLTKIKMSMGSVKEKIKKLLDKSLNYFGSRTETQFESIFDTDNLAGLEDYELLHPKIRKLFIEDVTVKDQKKIGRIDLYVDVSGSMSSECGIKDDIGYQLTKTDFAKAFAAQLLKMDILNNVFKFDDRVTKIRTDIISISLLGASGGTTIDNVIKSIEKNGVNAIVITDAEDRCTMYSDKAFFIGIKGCQFYHFEKDVMEQYSEKEQAVSFDGSRINKINADGYVIN